MNPGPEGSAADEVRERIMRGTIACIERWGLAKTTVEDVAREAGMSRATVYRYFPDGRDQVVSETITWEVGRFWARLAAEVAPIEGFAEKVASGLAYGSRAVGAHGLLQQILRTEPELLLAELNASNPLVLAVLRDTVAGMLAGEPLREGVDLDEAADYVARMFLSLIGSPGSWDLSDPAEVTWVVRTELLGGILAE